MRSKSLLFILAVNICLASLAADDMQIVKRMHAHMLLNDPASALLEFKEAQILYPESQILQEAFVEALAQSQDEQGTLKAWEQLVSQFPDEWKNRVLIESIAWGSIEKALTSSAPNMRLMGSLGAFFANDARSVRVLKASLRDSNVLVRAIAVQLASNMRDLPLGDEVMRLFREEPSFHVRLEVIKAVGKMKIIQARDELETIIGSSRTSAEEKAAAIQSIVSLIETADREEVMHLAKSNRAGLRLLACEVVAHFDLHRDLDFIMPLLQDSHAEVRAAALRVLGYLRVKSYANRPIMDYVTPLIADHNYHVAITAAWVMMLNDALEGQQYLVKWLTHNSRDVRLFATAILAAAGKYGFPLAIQVFHTTEDPYVRMNLALGFIAQRVETDAAAKVLADGLNNLKENWMLQEAPFKVLMPSKHKQSDLFSEDPRAVNQVVRLEVLSILAIVKYPQVQEALKGCLKDQVWGITWLAASLLLTEGDEEALTIVRHLLNDSDPNVRIQSALLLALWGRDEQSIGILQEAYKKADRERKAHILEGLGRVGAENAIPFLMTVLQEPHQTLRVVAACAILQSLNH